AIDARYSTIKAAHAKTCRWLLQRPEYKDWYDVKKAPDHHGLLWIKGKPGSGKSTLLKFVVANVRKTREDAVVISFFFNARGEELERSTLGMYRSLLFQLLRALPDLQVVLDCFRLTGPHDGDSHTWTESDLQSLFMAAIQKLEQRRLICFIDALDECGEDQIRDLMAFLEQLGELATMSQIHFRVCLSSRHYPYISIENGIPLILEGQEGHVEDIARYLNCELKAGRGKQVQAIKEEVLNRASGIFLWVALVVQILNKEYDHGRVHALWRRLREIPDGLDKLFEDILTRDRENSGELILCLQWILHATRPLKREELYYAILSGTDDKALADSTPEITTMERFILSCSKGLAETTKSKMQTVQFIHESVRDFLLGKHGFNKLKSELGYGQSHERLKECCYAYIKLDTSEYFSPSVELPVANSDKAKDLRGLVSEKFPFLEYAVHNVLSHADSAEKYGISQEAFAEEFGLSDWIMFYNFFEKYQVRRHPSDASLMNILAKQNLGNFIRTQLGRESYPTDAGELFGTERYTAPLYAALADAKVKEDTIRALLIPIFQTLDCDRELHNARIGCDIDCQRAALETIITKRPKLNPCKGEDMMDWAALNGHEDVVRFLLANTNIDRKRSHPRFGNPLVCAASNGHEAVVSLLLATGIYQVTATDKEGRTPLSHAAKNGLKAAVSLLLANENVDPDRRDKHGQTPLSHAAENGHTAVVSTLLVNENIELNSIAFGRTPLARAAKNGHEAVVRLLLAQEGIELNSRDGYSDTPLGCAASGGHVAVVNILLAKEGVELNSKDRDGRTPLALAALNGHKAVLNLLLAKDNIELNSKDEDGKTPLALAAQQGSETVVNLLLAKENIELNSKDRDGNTPLYWAIRNRREAVVDLLLAKENIELNLKDEDGETPLALAVLSGLKRVVNLLLAKENIKLNSKEGDGRTPLAVAVIWGEVEVVNLLLAKENIELNSKDRDGRTPLSYAATYPHEHERKAMVNALLEKKDIELNSKDKDGRTPLSLAAEKGHEAVVNLLLAKENIELNSRDRDGRTPLLYAVSNEQEAVVNLLLSKKNIDPNSREHSAQTPLLLATLKRRQAVLGAAKEMPSGMYEGQEALVKMLLARNNIDFEPKDKNGRTPLSLAVSSEHGRALNILLARKDVDPSSIDSGARTPLLLATIMRQGAVIKMLLARNDIDPDSRGRYGRTPLSYAAACGDEAIVKLLLESGSVDYNNKDSEGRTPLSYAATCGSEAVVKLLLTSDSIDNDMRDSEGRTPLSYAAAHGNEAVVKLLLTSDIVDLDTKDSRGRTPLSYAAGCGNTAVVKLLLNSDSVGFDAKDREGRTPLWWAKLNGREEVVKLLLAKRDVNMALSD
ncbi:MAG: hypothetical protein LQ338_007535, partial [Usnochroma carphineum]